MTQAEIDETLHVAMTVGATRMQVMLNSETAALAGTPAQEESAAGSDAPPDRAQAFQAQEVVQGSGDG